MVHDTRMYNEILRSYAGIIRIRFMGMISASVNRGTPANDISAWKNIVDD